MCAATLAGWAPIRAGRADQRRTDQTQGADHGADQAAAIIRHCTLRPANHIGEATQPETDETAPCGSGVALMLGVRVIMASPSPGEGQAVAS